jgi:hypothetical protein
MPIRFPDRDMFMRFTGMGIGHQATRTATRALEDEVRDALNLTMETENNGEDEEDSGGSNEDEDSEDDKSDNSDNSDNQDSDEEGDNSEYDYDNDGGVDEEDILGYTAL